MAHGLPKKEKKKSWHITWPGGLLIVILMGQYPCLLSKLMDAMILANRYFAFLILSSFTHKIRKLKRNKIQIFVLQDLFTIAGKL